MYARFPFPLFFLFLAFSLSAQTKKGFKSLKNRQWEDSRTAFVKDTADEKKSAAAFFGLAKTYEPFVSKSLDSAILSARFLRKARTLLDSQQEDVLKFAQEYQVTKSACGTLAKRIETDAWAGVEKRKSWKEQVLFCKTFPEFCEKNKNRVEGAAWATVERDKTFESLENLRERFPDFFKRNQNEKVIALHRKIVRETYEKTTDYQILSRLVQFHRDLLYNDNISMDSDFDSKLWKVFRDEVGVQNLEQFIQDHPDHWVSNDCWASQAGTALKKGSLKDLISFFERYPSSYLAYSPMAWHLHINFRNDAESIKSLNETERSRMDEILETQRIHIRLSNSGECPADTAALLSLIRRGAPSWRSFFLLETALENYVRVKKWDNALWLVSSAKSFFPNVEPDRCRSFDFRRETWFTSMEDILKSPYEPLNPRPITELNTDANEVLPFVSPDRKTLYFTGEGRPDGLRQEDPYEVSFMDSTFGKPQLIKGLAGEQNESLLSITADGQEALVFIDGVLHMSRMTDKGWSKPEEVPGLRNTFPWVGKASMTADGSALVFEAMTSRPLPGQSPNMDIYVALRDEKGDWRKPMALPSNINTRFGERSPYIHLGGKTLYFSSNGHLGLGGMDVFKTSRLDSTWQKWEDPVNMGKEINTVEDDWGFNFSVTADGKTAFFSQKDTYSGRKGELMIAGLPPKMRSKAVRVVEIPVKSVTATQLQMKDRNGVVIQTVPVKPGTRTATFVVEEAEELVTIAAKGNDILAQPVEINLTQPQATMKIDTVKAVSVKELIENKSVFQIPDVRFDRSESTLRPDAMLALNKFFRAVQGKNLRFNITGHTDNVGTIDKNQKLSEDRAQAVKVYLVDRGYPETLIATFGKGWSEPKVPNTSEQNKAINRRVEFQFVK